MAGLATCVVSFTKMMKRKSDKVFIVVISLVLTVLFFLPTGFENPRLRDATIRERATILSVDNQDLQTMGVIQVGTQLVTMKILSGAFRGDTVSGSNILMGQMRLDKLFKPGDKVLAVLKLDAGGASIISARADDY